MLPSRQTVAFMGVLALLTLITGLTSAQQAVSLSPASSDNPDFDHGVIAFLIDQNLEQLSISLAELGVRWIKQEVEWRDLEPIKGEIDFTALDAVVEFANEQGFKILLTVTTAPDWARTSNNEDGPPDNYADYGVFAGALAQRYVGKVQAYEVWSEPNLRREWNSSLHPLSANSYIELLRVGYTAIKQADPAAVVVSAGLAPTGFNDSINALNDREFLRDMYTAGLANASDAIGAHPKGWANPPDALCCVPPVGVETHYEHPSFYFLNTLNDYRQIMLDNGDRNTSIWVTDFGWGTSEDTTPPGDMHIFVTYTDLQEQAMYVSRGFELGRELGFVGPMFLDNLNGCQTSGRDIDSCYYSLLGPDGSPRPAFIALANRLNAEVSAESHTSSPQTTIATETPEAIPQTEPVPESTASPSG